MKHNYTRVVGPSTTPRPHQEPRESADPIIKELREQLPGADRRELRRLRRLLVKKLKRGTP
jgi:hypothetical protein